MSSDTNVRLCIIPSSLLQVDQTTFQCAVDSAGSHTKAVQGSPELPKTLARLNLGMEGLDHDRSDDDAWASVIAVFGIFLSC